VFRLLYLTPAQASSGVFAAATGVNRSNSTYFQPYWLPKSISSTPFPVFEMLGPFIGSLATEPRLPQGDDTTKSAENLWMACEDVLHAKNVHIK
jgi:hypothetical protein